jgi:hypothetical protein
MVSKTKWRKKMARHHEHKSVELPELEDWMPAALLDGDKFPPYRHQYYTPDGEPIQIDASAVDAYAYAKRLTEVVNLVFEDYKKRPENHIVSTPFYRHGTRIYVSTVYLGLNHGHGNIPLIWETMVFVGNGAADVFCARYATRAAAYKGHRDVTQAIREAQRARRQVWDNRPQRVLMTQKQTVRA